MSGGPSSRRIGSYPMALVSASHSQSNTKLYFTAMYRSNSSSSVEQLLASEIGSSVHRVPSACTSGQARSSEEQLPASSSWLLEEQLLASSSWLLAKAGSTPFVLSGRLVFTGICV